MMKKVIGLAALFFFLASVSVAGYGYFKYRDMTEQWYEPLQPSQQDEEDVPSSHPSNDEEGEKEKKEEEPVALKPFNMMILGVDSRGEERRSRSDTMMLAAVNPLQQKVTLLSIPRDTLAKIPGHGRDKFNHSMFFGGPPLVKETMEKFFEIKIDHYVSVDFEGFTHLVDELGGIEVNVKRRMKYHDPTDDTEIDLYPGVQRLNGEQALDYARFRKSDIGSDASDFDRMDRQQEVVRKITDEATALTSVFRVFNLMEILGEHVKMDFTEEEVRKLAILFRNFSSSSIATVELKGLNQRIPLHGYNLWVYVVEEAEKKRIQSIIQETLSPKVVTTGE